MQAYDNFKVYQKPQGYRKCGQYANQLEEINFK
jgi:hypothetical protein